MKKEKYIFALGMFDGVHLGHQALLDACRELAAQRGAAAGVITFSVHPESLVTGNAPRLINTLEDRCDLLRQQGMETVVTLAFDEALRTLPWQDFIALLMDSYHAAGFVCGSDFRFGYRGEGTAQLLQESCESAGIPCRIVEQVEKEGIRVSSTYIRTLLEQGRMERATEFLGHPHILSGEVLHGRQLGRTIGIPTANLHIPQGVIVPKFGVYACKARLEDGQTYLAVTNVGNRPTVDGKTVTVEAWLPEFQGDLYGKKLTLEFYSFLRPEQKFPDLDALRSEIQKNRLQAGKFFEKQ